MPEKIDYFVIGAGLAGLVVANRLSSKYNKKVLVVDKRSHVGGNCYDKYDEAGVLIHPYGPHYFRTNSEKVKQYLDKYTQWRKHEYKILSFVNGEYWNFPINLNTFEKFIGRPSSTEEMEEWLNSNKVSIKYPNNSEEVVISQIGWELYEKFFKGYTMKQWNRHPKELEASVCARIPIRTNRDNRYLSERFQAMPKDGYSEMFRNMISECKNNLKIILNVDYRVIISKYSFKALVYTGAIDEYYDYSLGRLPYRSLKFEPETFNSEALQKRNSSSKLFIPKGYYQPTVQVNYPNTEDFTRIVEIKHATGQTVENTTIIKEYPDDFGPGKEPYYPVPTLASNNLYGKYEELTRSLPIPYSLGQALSLVDERPQHFVNNLPKAYFVGRLATYKYLNMDQVTAIALKKADEIALNAINNER